MNLLSHEFSHQAALYDLANKCIVEPLKKFVETIRNFKSNPFCFYWILSVSCSLTTIIALLDAYFTDKTCLFNKFSLLTLLSSIFPYLFLWHMRIAIFFVQEWKKVNDESEEMDQIQYLSADLRRTKETINRVKRIRKVVASHRCCLSFLSVIQSFFLSVAIARFVLNNYGVKCNIDLAKKTTLICITAISLQIILGALILMGITRCFQNLSKLEAKLDDAAEQEQVISTGIGTDAHDIDSFNFPLTLPISR